MAEGRMEMPQWLGIEVPPGSESRACAHEGFPGTWEARCFPPPNYRYRKDRTRTFQACGGGVDPLQERPLRQISRWCRANRHQFVRDQHVQLVRKLRGHFAYFGIRGNYRSMGVLRFRVERIWIKWLSRRSQRGRLNWEKAAQLLKLLPLPAPRISKACY